MAHYDSLWEDVSREDIVDRIEKLKNIADGYKEKENLLEEDLLFVQHEVSRELIRNESDRMFVWAKSYRNEVARLNKLLADYDKGAKVERYEINRLIK